MAHTLGTIKMHAHKAMVRVIKRHMSWYTVPEAVILAHHEVQRGMGVYPLIKTSVVGIELKNLLVCPSEMLGLVTFMNEICCEIRTCI